jgi:hypothetical protein
VADKMSPEEWILHVRTIARTRCGMKHPERTDIPCATCVEETRIELEPGGGQRPALHPHTLSRIASRGSQS